jgi:hypothetical protein
MHTPVLQLDQVSIVSGTMETKTRALITTMIVTIMSSRPSFEDRGSSISVRITGARITLDYDKDYYNLPLDVLSHHSTTTGLLLQIYGLDLLNSILLMSVERVFSSLSSLIDLAVYAYGD